MSNEIIALNQTNGNIHVFHYDQNSIRTVLIGGEPWFVAVDVCAVLEIQNTADAPPPQNARSGAHIQRM